MSSIIQLDHYRPKKLMDIDVDTLDFQIVEDGKEHFFFRREHKELGVEMDFRAPSLSPLVICSHTQVALCCFRSMGHHSPFNMDYRRIIRVPEEIKKTGGVSLQLFALVTADMMIAGELLSRHGYGEDGRRSSVAKTVFVNDICSSHRVLMHPTYESAKKYLPDLLAGHAYAEYKGRQGNKIYTHTEFGSLEEQQQWLAILNKALSVLHHTVKRFDVWPDGRAVTPEEEAQGDVYSSDGKMNIRATLKNARELSDKFGWEPKSEIIYIEPSKVFFVDSLQEMIDAGVYIK